MMDGDLRRAKISVNAAFFANGLNVGHWAPKIPVMVERLGISEAALGQLIILFGVGALVALIGGAWLVTKIGSVLVIRWTSILLAPSLVLITLAPSVFVTALCLIWLGIFLGAMDNAMNANGVAVEVALDRPVMSSYHAWWSVGGVVGGLTGGALIVWFGELGHAVIVMLITLMVALWAWPGYMPDDNMDAKFEAEREIAEVKSGSFGLPKSVGIYILGVVTMLSFAPEGTIIDWSALYLKNELASPLIVSGYAVAAFSATMALMRFAGDGIRSHFGDRKTFIVSAAVAALGMLIGGVANDFYTACFGFLSRGFGYGQCGACVVFRSG
ncbi:MAG: MFS transporter [Ahrensia sp.]|nr:MFS transporter [Ahrensia sp.]